MIKENSLYLVISEEYCLGRSSFEVAGKAIEGGVDIIQIREKNKTPEELRKLGGELSALCKEKRVTFIVNDDPKLAKEVNACGVHLGQEDVARYTLKDARKTLGRDKIIGISTHSPEQFRRANDEDVDYIAYGPIFRTKTKNYFLGTNGIKDIVQIAKKPVFFIGGIDISNIGEVLERGARNIALIRGITEAEDITAKTKEFKRLLRPASQASPACR
jgi:thiamine-phosphate pyrophosphorylase